MAWDFACIRYAGSVYDEAVVSSRNFVHIRITRANVNMPGHIFNVNAPTHVPTNPPKNLI